MTHEFIVGVRTAFVQSYSCIRISLNADTDKIHSVSTATAY